MALQMFLSMIRVPQTCFEIALTWSSSKGQTLDTRRDSSLSQGEDEEVADGPNDNFNEVSKKMGFHSHVNKAIIFVRSNDIMVYARGMHTQLNID